MLRQVCRLNNETRVFYLFVYQEQEEVCEDVNTALAVEEARSHFYQRRVYLELELQDNKVTSASKMLRSMKTLFSLARKGGITDQEDLWESRIDELESIMATSGKGPAIAYAQSFFAGKAGMSSAKLIEINQRAKQCYKAARKLKNRSVYLSSSEEGTSDEEIPQRRLFRQRKRFQSFDRRGVGQNSRGQRACFNCSATDHIASGCPLGKRSPFYKPQQRFEHATHKPTRRCLICKDKAHMAIECPLNPINAKKNT